MSGQKAINFPIQKTRSLRVKSDESVTSVARSVSPHGGKRKSVNKVAQSPDKTNIPSRLEVACGSYRRSSRHSEKPSKLVEIHENPERSSHRRNIFHSPEKTSQKPKILAKHNEEEEEEREKGSLTPSKRKSGIILPDSENDLSLTKRLVVTLHQLPLDSIHLTPSKACRKLMADSTSEENTCPLSPKKTTQSVPLRPVRFASPSRSSSTAEPKLTSVCTPQKYPLSSSSITNTGKSSESVNSTGKSSESVKSTCKSSESVNRVIFQSPRKCTVKCHNLNSPVKTLKRLDENRSLRSPRKHFDDDSVRRSPRKFNQENVLSPRRSPRKLAQSPFKVNSPASLVSKLSLESSANARTDVAVRLFKPDVTAYRAVRQCLNTGTPTVLMCREKQVNEMRDFLTHHLTNTIPGSLYVSGPPGTGKTASLNYILDSLQVNKIRRIFVNCMTVKTSGAIYKAIVSGLKLTVSGTDRENLRTVERALTSSKIPVLIMLDEVDQLDSKNQEVLYTIFEWPSLAGSTLVLVGIANSLDLTDRILPRLQARPSFKPKLLHFPPYTRAEIIKIINQRLQEAGLGNLQVIRPNAIQFLAGKVASVAGDVRKALDVCRRAVELCEIQARKQTLLKPSNGSPRKSPLKRQENTVPKVVEIPQVLSIFNEVYGSRVITAVTEAPESFPLQQKVIVCCLLLIIKYGRTKDVTLGKFHEVYIRVCKKRQMPGMDQTEFLSVCTLLESRGMVQVKRAKELRSSKISLRLNAEEAEHALGDRTLLASVLEDKQSLGKLCKA
ncbi:hypothetical protein OTU49_012108 [Cherax quadricarinatus]|uniref:Cell division control protein n=1 Tax=Cherax quadricarinatus TaxID=27406 RepID=A0AAW0W3J5_CHEQU